jgi:hypothetical protein
MFKMGEPIFQVMQGQTGSAFTSHEMLTFILFLNNVFIVTCT